MQLALLASRHDCSGRSPLGWGQEEDTLQLEMFTFPGKTTFSVCVCVCVCVCSIAKITVGSIQ
jgi:hypothetical protein